MVTRVRVENGDDGAIRLVPVAPDRGEPFTVDAGIRGHGPLSRLRGQTVTLAGTGWTDCSGSVSAAWAAGLLLTREQAALVAPPPGLLALLAPAPTAAGWPFVPADQRSVVRPTWFGGTRVASSAPVGAERLVDGVLVFTDADAFWRSVFWGALSSKVRDAPDLDETVTEALARALSEGGPAFRAVDAERESLALGLYAPNPEDDPEGRLAAARLALLLGVPAAPSR